MLDDLKSKVKDLMGKAVTTIRSALEKYEPIDSRYLLFGADLSDKDSDVAGFTIFQGKTRRKILESVKLNQKAGYGWEAVPGFGFVFGSLALTKFTIEDNKYQSDMEDGIDPLVLTTFGGTEGELRALPGKIGQMQCFECTTRSELGGYITFCREDGQILLHFSLNSSHPVQWPAPRPLRDLNDYIVVPAGGLLRWKSTILVRVVMDTRGLIGGVQNTYDSRTVWPPKEGTNE